MPSTPATPGTVLIWGTDDPVLNRAQVGRPLQLGTEALALRGQVAPVRLPTGFAVASDLTFLRLCVVDRPHKDFAKASRNWTHAGLGPRGQILLYLRQALSDLLSGEVNISLLTEDGGNLGESVT